MLHTISLNDGNVTDTEVIRTRDALTVVLFLVVIEKKSKH